MKVLLIGAGSLGAEVIKQLRKNSAIELVVVDPRERPKAVVDGVIPRVDIQKHVTPLSFEEIVDETKPDMAIIARTLEDWDQFDNLGGSQYVIGMERELTKYDIPVIPASSRVLGPC